MLYYHDWNNELDGLVLQTLMDELSGSLDLSYVIPDHTAECPTNAPCISRSLNNNDAFADFITGKYDTICLYVKCTNGTLKLFCKMVFLVEERYKALVLEFFNNSPLANWHEFISILIKNLGVGYGYGNDVDDLVEAIHFVLGTEIISTSSSIESFIFEDTDNDIWKYNLLSTRKEYLKNKVRDIFPVNIVNAAQKESLLLLLKALNAKDVVKSITKLHSNMFLIILEKEKLLINKSEFDDIFVS